MDARYIPYTATTPKRPAWVSNCLRGRDGSSSGTAGTLGAAKRHKLPPLFVRRSPGTIAAAQKKCPHLRDRLAARGHLRRHPGNGDVSADDPTFPASATHEFPAPPTAPLIPYP
jgi:hypothetical protein